MHYIFKKIFPIIIVILSLQESKIFGQVSIGKKDTIIISRSTISTKDNEYSPIVNNGYLYYTSDKPVEVGNLTWNEDFGLPTNLYRAKIKDSTRFSNISSLDKINTDLNEGPLCILKNGIIYSATKKSSNKLKSKNLVSRLYYIESLEDSSISTPIEVDIPINDSISLSHPAIYKDTILFYTYIKIGTKTGSDLYYSFLHNNTWSQPIKCLGSINSEQNECFPTIQNDFLYFSSNRDNGIGMLDLYKLDLNKLNSEPILLSNFNSSKDDFGLIFTSENEGYFSSNRRGTDDIFKFKQSEIPKFTNCIPQQFNTYCYNFKEATDYQTKDTVNMYYEWDFGDGKKSKGLVVDHCFDGEGKYEIKLNIIQKSNDEFYDNQLNYDLDILNVKQLYISCFDTAAVNDTIEFDTQYTNIENFTVEKFYWQIETLENYYFEGPILKHIFTKPGAYTIKLLAIGSENNIKKNYCAYRQIIVQENTYSKNLNKRIPLINKINDQFKNK